MLLRQMKYFVAVIDCNSFTEAAEQCYIFPVRYLSADPVAGAGTGSRIDPSGKSPVYDHTYRSVFLFPLQGDFGPGR